MHQGATIDGELHPLGRIEVEEPAQAVGDDEARHLVSLSHRAGDRHTERFADEQADRARVVEDVAAALLRWVESDQRIVHEGERQHLERALLHPRGLQRDERVDGGEVRMGDSRLLQRLLARDGDTGLGQSEK